MKTVSNISKMKTSKNFLILTVLCCIVTLVNSQDFVHPGILHKESDFARMRQKVAEKTEPWYTAWNNLLSTPEASLSWTPRATATIIRGGTGDNISLMYRDVAAAYQHALIYSINGDKAHANKAIEILNAWSLINKSVSGNADRYLASGLNGYQFANAAEMMRDYPGFDLKRFQKYMLDVFYYPMNERFVISNNWGSAHNDAWPTNYRVNWDICNMNAMLAISILCDNKENFNKTINYSKTGDGNGNITRAVNFIHSSIWGQWEESGRDQGHATGGMGLYGLFCEIAWNQGVDMYSHDDFRFRKGAEYVARYNILENSAGKYNDLPYTSYTFKQGPLYGGYWTTESALSPSVRGKLGFCWDGIYSHYANRLNQPEKVQSINEILKQQSSVIWPSTAIHADTYDTPGGEGLTLHTDSGYSILPWINMDINARSITKLPNYGTSLLKDSTLTLIGAGTGIKGVSDQFQFTFQKLIDDGYIETQITSLDEDNTLCQAGIMIRENLQQNSTNIFLNLSTNKGLILSARDSIGLITSNIQTNTSINTFPYWLRISRVENIFTAFVSTDKLNWTEVGRKEIKMNRLVYVGLAVSSNDINVTCTTVFNKSKISQGNMRPFLKLFSPKTGVVQYVAPANVIISGSAYDIDGLLDKAEIYLNNNLIYTTKLSPFTYNLSAQTEGNYSVYVKVYDRLGASTVSDTVHYTINAITTKLPWYKCDESKTSYFAYDSGGSSLTGILYGGATHVVGKINNSTHFDGIDDYIKIPNGTIEKLSDFTISTWIYTDTITSWSRIFDFGSSTSVNMFLTISDGTGKMKFSLSGANNVNQSVIASTTLPIKTWAFVVVTLEANKLNIYLDGKLIGTSVSFTNRPYDLGATTANYIGKSQYTADPYFQGNIDEFRFYNRALTIEEILAAMSLTPVESITENPCFFYPNPAKEQIHFSNKNDFELKIYDTVGKLVFQKSIKSTNETININHLKQGIYIVKMSDKYSNTQQNKLIIK